MCLVGCAALQRAAADECVQACAACIVQLMLVLGCLQLQLQPYNDSSVFRSAQLRAGGLWSEVTLLGG